VSEFPSIDRTRLALAPHLIWEGILAGLVVIASVLGALVPSASVFAHGSLFLRFGLLLPVAVGLALSLRTGTPNLAVGGIAAMSGVLYAELMVQGAPAVVAGLVAVLIALVFGAVLAFVTALTRAPGWAVSLAGLAVAESVALGVANNGNILLRGGGLGTGVLDTLAVVFALVSVAGGALWLMPAVRAAFAPGQAGRVSLLGALLGFVGSSGLAALAGVFQAGYLHAASATDATAILLTAVGAVLLGGVSASGRGGGIAGTVLGAFLLTVIYFWAVIEAAPFWVNTLVPAAVAIVLGAVVSRFVNQD
jgi:ribose/xylose/arabinose/galactoside ABC-type transport system permease subunit